MEEQDDFLREVEERAQRRKASAPRAKAVTDAAWNRALDRNRGSMYGSEEAGAIDFVALHALLFECAYGVAPMDLGPSDRLKAAGVAAGLAKRVFGWEKGDVEATERVVAYVRWVWRREAEREEWRRRNRKSGQVLGWRIVFSTRLLNEYQLDRKRTG